MSDNLTVFGTDFTGVTGIKATGTGNGTLTYIRPQGTKSISANGTGIDVTEYAAVDVAVPSSAPNLQAKTNISPTTSSQTIQADSGYDGLSSVQINAMPSGAVSASAAKGSVSNHAISVTPTATVGTAGYLAAGSTNGTAVSVSASELVSGTYTVSASGTHDVTNYASASVAAGGATASATKGTVSNHSVTVTPSVTRTAGYVTAGTANGTAVTVSASELVSGSETKTINGTYDVTNLAQLVVDVQGGSSGMQVATATATPSVAASSISFTVSGQPTSFYVTSAADLATGAAPYKAAAVTYDGTDLHGQIVTNTTNAQASYSTAFTQSYSGGTLTVSSTGANFQPVQYRLVYTYGGTSANVGTAETQVGSGATSVTFTGLTDEPTCFSVVFKSNFSTSSGYQRVIAVTHDGSSTYGLAMDSAANAQSSWSYTYSNGSLTVTSQGTNNGGYFHQPGYYQLTYGIGGEVEPTEIDVQPLSVTQNGVYTAPDGVAYSPVTVAVSGGGSSKNVQVAQSTTRVASTSYTKTASLTCSVTGTYDVYWDCFRSSTSGTNGSQLYIGGSEYGNANTTFSSNIHAQSNHLTGVSISANQEVAVYVRSRGTNYYAYCGQLTIVQTA